MKNNQTYRKWESSGLWCTIPNQQNGKRTQSDDLNEHLKQMYINNCKYLA